MAEGASGKRNRSRGASVWIAAVVLFGSALVLTAPAARADMGGPDAAHYVWTDSNPPDPTVAFSWDEISATGTRINTWTNSADDGYAGPFNLGFTFPFYGQSHSQVYIGTNGYLTFGSGSGTIPYPNMIPSSLTPNNLIMGYGADLNPGPTLSPAGVYYQMLTSPTRFVVEYSAVPHYPNQDPVTFEMTLYPSGEVWFEYQSLLGPVYTVGIENSDGSIGLTYPEALANNLAVRFSIPEGIDMDPPRQVFPGIAGNPVFATLTVGNGGSSDDTIDLTADAPSGWAVSLFESDGSTPLADTDSDGVPDTGLLNPAESVEVSIMIDIPAAARTSVVTVAGVSSVDPDVRDLAAIEVLITPMIVAPPPDSAPIPDGSIGAGEWSGAHVEDLIEIENNVVPALLLVAADASFLYVAYDAYGDTVSDSFDVASIAFDSDNNGIPTNGRDDQFVQGGWAPNNQGHFVFASVNGTWVLHDSPYNPSLPNHAGLASAWGFGPSPRSATPHRMYEFRIPLALLGVTSGDTLGFFGGSNPAPGVYDNTSLGWSLWPEYAGGPIPLGAYGNLLLGDSIPPSVFITAPGAVVNTSSVVVTWTASDLGTGIDRFEVQLDGGSPTTLPSTARSHMFSDVDEGPHAIVVTAFDGAGNERSDALAVTVDTAAPTLTLTTPAAGAFLATSTLQINWTAADATTAVVGFEVRLDTGTVLELPASARGHVFPSLADGTHAVMVTAIDEAGNEATATRSVTVDTVHPVVAIATPTGDVVTSNAVTVRWTATDATSEIDRVEIQLDGGAAQVVTGGATSHVFTGVSDGEHTVTVTVFDQAGNSDSESRTFRVDTSIISPSGPFGIFLITGIIVAIGAVAAVALILMRRRRPKPPPQLPPVPPLPPPQP